jgi:hypothetical protein
VKNLLRLLVVFILVLSCDKAEDATAVFQGKLVWTKTLGGSLEDKTTSAVATPDGGVIVVGYTQSNDGDIIKTHDLYDVWVTKLDANGNVVWNKTYGGSDNDYGYSIIKTNDNNYVIAGYSASADFDVPKNEGMHDFYILKINENGDIIWSKSYGFPSHDHAHKIIQMSDGGFFVAGFADYAGLIGQSGNGEGHQMNKNVRHGVGEFFGIRLDANGDFLWFRFYGGTKNDRVNDIVETNGGGVMMVGFSESNDFDVSGNKGSYDYWVVNIAADGHLHWKKTYGGPDIDQAFGVIKTDFNSYLIVGQSNSVSGDITKPKGNSDIWVIHIDQHGKLIWEKSFGGSQFETANSIKKTGFNKFVVIGNSRSSDNQISNKGQNDIYLFEIDANPNSRVHWQKTYGGSDFDFGTDITQTSDGKLYIVGDYQSTDGNFNQNKGLNDRFIMKLE